MRKLVLQMQTSIDGYISGPDGLDWAVPDFKDPSYVKWEVDKIWQAGAHLMGSATYREMAATWPTSKEPFAPPMNEIPKIVFSREMKETPWGETRIVSGDLAEEITRLKQESGKELLAHGGVRFAQSLVATGLIDEYRLLVHPVAIATGKPLFSAKAGRLRLRLKEAVTLDNGVVASIYLPP